MAEPNDPNGKQISPLGPGEDQDMQSRPDKALKQKRGKGSARKAVTKQEADALVQDFRNRQNDEKRQRLAARAPRQSLIRIGLASVLGLTAIVSGVATVSSAKGYEEQVAQNNATLQELRSQQDETAEKKESLPDVEVVEVARDDAVKQAQEMLKLAKDVATYDFATQDKPEDNDQQAVVFAAMTDKLEQHFTQQTVASGTFKVISGWFVPYAFVDNLWSQMPLDAWQWDIVYTHDVNEDGTIPMVFENKIVKGEFEGEVAAIVTGTYNPTTRKFSNMAQYITKFGQVHTGSTAGSQAVEVKEFKDDLVKEAREGGSSTEMSTHKLTPEEASVAPTGLPEGDIALDSGAARREEAAKYPAPDPEDLPELLKEYGVDDNAQQNSANRAVPTLQQKDGK